MLGVSDVSARGTVLRDCVAEGLRLIFIPVGVEDDEETRNDEGACRAGREGYPLETLDRTSRPEPDRGEDAVHESLRRAHRRKASRQPDGRNPDPRRTHEPLLSPRHGRDRSRGLMMKGAGQLANNLHIPAQHRTTRRNGPIVAD
jgi:hypothetical protein